MKYILLRYFFSLMISGFHIVNAQSKADEMAILNWYDQLVGQENLDISKGLIYQSTFFISDVEHPFYNSNEFQSGNIVFDNQSYFKVKLKYDIINDQVLLLPENQSFGITLVLEKSKISRFEIYNKIFILLPTYKDENNSFESGFFEERFVDQKISLFIKHTKKSLQKIMDEGIRNFFSKNTDFYLKKNDFFYEIDSKSDVVKLFLSQKNQINDFYKNNTDLKKNNEEQFMTNLFGSLSKNE